MRKARDAPVLTGGVLLLAVAVFGAAGVGVVAARRHGHRASPSSGRAPAGLTTAVPFTARPGPNGATILQETVDPLSLTVPGTWKAPSPDALTLPQELATFAQAAPALAGLLAAQSTVAAKNGIRLFAYQQASPAAFVSVLSYSTPSATDLTPAVVAAVAGATKPGHGLAVSGEALPVGEVLKIDSSPVVGKQHLLVEVVVLVSMGRTIVIQLASEVNTAGIPPLFGEIGQSLSQK
jgi:hypothetical protein